MSTNVYSLSLTNLALDGSLELFVDLHKMTYRAYFQKLKENPLYINDRDELNTIVIPEIIPEYEFVLFKRLRLFTKKIRHAHLDVHHFSHFDFFDSDKISQFRRKQKYNEEYKRRVLDGETYLSELIDERYLSKNNEQFELQETVIDIQQLVDLFRRIAIRVVCEEIPEYDIFDARKEVDECIAKRMEMRRMECIIPNNINCPLTSEPLFVFDSLNNTACKIKKHNVVSKKYYAKHGDGKNIVVLPTHYCETCKRYMVGSLSLSLFRKYYGKFAVHTRTIDSENCDEWLVSGESKLHQLGYNVVEGNLTEGEREGILISVVENKYLSLFEVVSTIERNIRMFENDKRMQNALVKWQTDLKFINEYMLNKKR